MQQISWGKHRRRLRELSDCSVKSELREGERAGVMETDNAKKEPSLGKRRNNGFSSDVLSLRCFKTSIPKCQREIRGLECTSTACV